MSTFFSWYSTPLFLAEHQNWDRMKSEILREYYLFKKEDIKEEKSIFKKTRVTKYILKKQMWIYSRLLTIKQMLLKNSLSTYRQPSYGQQILQPSRDLRNLHGLRRTLDTPLWTQAALKSCCQRLLRAKSCLGDSRETTLSGTTAHKGFCWKVNYSPSVFCGMSEVRPAPD